MKTIILIQGQCPDVSNWDSVTSASTERSHDLFVMDLSLNHGAAETLSGAAQLSFVNFLQTAIGYPACLILVSKSRTGYAIMEIGAHLRGLTEKLIYFSSILNMKGWQENSYQAITALVNNPGITEWTPFHTADPLSLIKDYLVKNRSASRFIAADQLTCCERMRSGRQSAMQPKYYELSN